MTRPVALDLALLEEGARELGVALPAGAASRFGAYYDLLRTWGGKMNLVGDLDPGIVVVHHFLDSLAGLPLLGSGHGLKVVDVGAGAGFPSIPLKICRPDLSLLLVDSSRKRIAFLQEVTRVLGLAGTTLVRGRAEDPPAAQVHRGTCEVGVCRAVGQAEEVTRLLVPFMRSPGRLLLYKGSPQQDELRELEVFLAPLGGSLTPVPVKVPHLDAARTILVIDLLRTGRHGSVS